MPTASAQNISGSIERELIQFELIARWIYTVI